MRDNSIHKFPFDDFPTLVSVVPPHFMIWKVGRLLTKNNRLHLFPSSKKYAVFLSVLCKIIGLYQLWSTREVPEGYEPEVQDSDLPPDGESGEDSNIRIRLTTSVPHDVEVAEQRVQGEVSGSAGQATGSKRRRDNDNNDENNDDNNIDRSSKKRHNEDRIVDPDGPYMGHVDQARVRRWIINTSKSLHSRPGDTC
jgi:hypothetical protein